MMAYHFFHILLDCDLVSKKLKFKKSLSNVSVFQDSVWAAELQLLSNFL